MLVELNPQIFKKEVFCISSKGFNQRDAYRVMLNAGKIKAFRIGRSYRIPKVNVIRFLQNETPEDCNTVNATIDSVE